MMISTIIFIGTALISLLLYIVVVFQIRKHQKMYRMPKKYRLNGKGMFFQKRFVLGFYFITLLLFFLIGCIVWFRYYQIFYMS
ncbi:hypothetical protein COB57_04490 [Candidatus Peregrinibacteria bacterium]|nr:MAG: hypothetical protein COB57_04490 [Candidatus Peregrinibacteria bacterium]